ncbi:unnamed protein product, partial [Discosporangium mesarthrocarpum]
QLLKWCGPDFDGCILLDECHRAKNLYAATGGAPTKSGTAVVELQQKLPNARVVYCSATGASEPRNLGYMVRLGLWGGAGSPFGNFQQFLEAVESRGVGAMELVAMHLKQTGGMVCRTLSFSGCTFEMVSDILSEDMEEVYNLSAAFWQTLRRELVAMLEEREQAMKGAEARMLMARGGILEEVDLDLSSDDDMGLSDTDEESSFRQKHRMSAPGHVWRYFWGAHQRFFRDLCIASKVPAAIAQARSALEEGKVCMFFFFLCVCGTGTALNVLFSGGGGGGGGPGLGCAGPGGGGGGGSGVGVYC